jgi:hypothetical protein
MSESTKYESQKETLSALAKAVPAEAGPAKGVEFDDVRVVHMARTDRVERFKAFEAARLVFGWTKESCRARFDTASVEDLWDSEFLAGELNRAFARLASV